MEYQLPNSTRRCSTTGRELRRGDRYFGSVVTQGDKLIRQDYSPEAWVGPTHEVVGHWESRVPLDEAPRRLAIDDELLLRSFRRLEDAVAIDRKNLRYVLALLLIRRKRLTLVDTKRDEAGEVLVLRDPKIGTQTEVHDPKLNSASLAAVQDEVYELLGWDEKEKADA